MRLFKSANAVVFLNEDLEKAFNSLSENSPLKKSIKKAILDLKSNAFCGERIRKELIPKEYIKKYNIDNLFWYSLSKEWRLVYSIVANKIKIIATIIEYFPSHKDYEKRFKY